jgi:hypothetical protein
MTRQRFHRPAFGLGLGLVALASLPWPYTCSLEHTAHGAAISYGSWLERAYELVGELL